MTTSNGELTITKSQGLPPTSNSTSSKSLHSHHLQSHRALSHHKNHHSHHQSSTSSATVTPTASMAATTDDEQTSESIEYSWWLPILFCFENFPCGKSCHLIWKNNKNNIKKILGYKEVSVTMIKCRKMRFFAFSTKTLRFSWVLRDR